MDYAKLWDRWVALTVISEDDRKDLIERLHGDVTSTVTVLATLAHEQIAKILTDAKYAKAEEYSLAVAPVLALGALDGYFLSLMERSVDPLTHDLAARIETVGIGEKWSKGHQKDQNRSYIDKIDSVISLMLEKIYLLRVNQTLAFHPEIVELPYKVTEKLHQYIGWCVYQGYVLGVLEQGE
jgi:hypothetical protein